VLKSPDDRFQRLKMRCDKFLSSLALYFNSRHYREGLASGASLGDFGPQSSYYALHYPSAASAISSGAFGGRPRQMSLATS